jgi:GDP-L-fucose synthase
MRDFIHIEDCVDGVLQTMERIDDGDALNLSTGILTSFKEFARLAAELCGYSPEVLSTSDRPEGVFARGGDTTKQKQFGFQYRLSFRDGIKKALAHFEAKK